MNKQIRQAGPAASRVRQEGPGLPEDQDRSIAAFEEVTRVLAHDARDALTIYLQCEQEVASKVILEWQLAEAIGRQAIVHDDVRDWPGRMLNRPSGAALAFVVDQNRGRASVLPSALRDRPPLGRQRLELLASAWARFPGGGGLGDPVLRRGFREWVGISFAALVDVLWACAELDDREAIVEMSERFSWLAATAPDLTRMLQRLAGFPSLRDVVLPTIDRALSVGSHRPDLLVSLMDLAMGLADVELANACARLLDPRSLTPDTARRLAAIRLVALAESGSLSELAEEFRTSWRVQDGPFPAPEPLLDSFQRTGDVESERALLATYSDPDPLPEWVALAWHRMRGSMPHAERVARWSALYSTGEGMNDERVLVGLTRAVAEAPRRLRGDWPERLGARWKTLGEFEGYADLSRWYRMLLADKHEDRVKRFEEGARWLSGPLANRAAMEYIRCLRRLRWWDRLRAIFNDPESRRLRALCPFQEFEYLQLFPGLGSPPAPYATVDDWARAWERLLSLPLDVEQVATVSGQFLNLMAEVREPSVRSHSSIRDLEVQILWRARAAAEHARLRWPIPAELHEHAGKALTHSDLRGVVGLLRKLETYRPDEDS